MKNDPEQFADRVKRIGFHALPSDEIIDLRDAPQGYYNQMLLTLLTRYSDDRYLHNGHRIDACYLYVFRPDLAIYNDMLTGILGIHCPSNIRYGADALKQAKPIDQVALDLLDQVSINWENEYRLAAIFYLFYWLGTGPRRLSGAGGPPFHIPKQFDLFRPLYQQTEHPKPDEEELVNTSTKIVECMVNVVETRDPDPAVRYCKAHLLSIYANIRSFSKVISTDLQTRLVNCL